MSTRKYDVLLFAKHGLYSPSFEPKHGWHNRMCKMDKGTFTSLSYNTNNGRVTKWNQHGGTSINFNADLRFRLTAGGSGGDPTKLGSWTWVRIGGKDGIATVFVSAYHPYHNPDRLHTVWSQQARYLKEHESIKVLDVHALFIRDLCKFLGDLCDKGNNIVLGMNANDNVQDGKVTKALMEIGIFKTVVSNHGGKSVSATCATSKQ